MRIHHTTSGFASQTLALCRLLSAIALQSAGYIKYARGLITVTDRAGLEDFTCDCYQTIKREYARLQK